MPTSKEDFSRFCRLLYERHLVTGFGGNAAVRSGDVIYVTPSGYSLRDMCAEVIVAVDPDGSVLGEGISTKDVHAHVGIMRARPEINVVCHAHGASLIALSTIVEPGPDVLPPITPGFVYFAHPLPMIPFMIPGTEEYARAAVEWFSDPTRRALLLQNHGLLSVGKTFEEALNVAEEIDEAAKVYLLTKGEGRIISEEAVGKIKNIP